MACLCFGIVIRPCWDAIYHYQKDNAGTPAPTSEALPVNAPTPAPTPEAAPVEVAAPVSDFNAQALAQLGQPESLAPTPVPTPEVAPVEVATPEITAPRATPVIRNHYVPADQLPGYHGEGAANRSVPAVTQEVPAPRATSVLDSANFVVSVLRNYNNHDYLALAPYQVSGHLNYFGHREATDAFIRHDMANDVRTYAEVNCTFQPETFKHEVSNEYSSHWEGPMVYDSITTYTEAREFNGKVHATTRFTVGYTSVNGVTKIYAMVDKVL
jgi:hypothetical protein